LRYASSTTAGADVDVDVDADTDLDTELDAAIDDEILILRMAATATV